MKAVVLSIVLAGLVSPQLTGHTREISSLAMSPNGKIIATGSVDMTVRLWDPASKQSTATLEGHEGEVRALAFSPDSSLLASGEMYKKVKIWDVAAKKELQTFTDIEGKVFGLAFSPDGKRVYAAINDNSAKVWTVGSAGEGKKLAHNYAVAGIAVSPDGKTVATIDEGGSLNLWDATTLKKTHSAKHGDTTAGFMSVTYNADGKWILTAGGGVVKIWDASGTEKASTKLEANCAAFSLDGATVVVGTQDNLVLALNAADLSVKWKQEKHERPVTGVAVSSDSKTAWSCSMDRTIRSWPL